VSRERWSSSVAASATECRRGSSPARRRTECQHAASRAQSKTRRSAEDYSRRRTSPVEPRSGADAFLARRPKRSISFANLVVTINSNRSTRVARRSGCAAHSMNCPRDSRWEYPLIRSVEERPVDSRGGRDSTRNETNTHPRAYEDRRRRDHSVRLCEPSSVENSVTNSSSRCWAASRPARG